MTETAWLFGVWRPWHPLNSTRQKSKVDRVNQQLRTYASCEITSNIGEPRPPRSTKNASPFQLFLFCCVHGLKTYGINGKEVLRGDWEELNKKTYICNVCYQTTSRFTSASKYKLINLLVFIFARTHSPSENSPLTFSHNSESLATLNQSRKKINIPLILSIITKEKFDRVGKSEKLLWCFTTLIAFVIAYIILIMRLGI